MGLRGIARHKMASMSGLRGLALAGTLSIAACSTSAVQGTAPEDDPSGDQRLKETLQVSRREPSRWSPAVTVPLYPVLLVADTTIKVVDATGRWAVEQVEFLKSLLFGQPSEPLPIPEAVERAAENLPPK